MTIANTAIVSSNAVWIMFASLRFRDLGLDDTLIGFTWTLLSCAMVIGILIGGRVADTYGRRRIAMVAYVVAAVGLVTMIPGFWGSSLAGFLIYGFGSGLGNPAIHAAIVESSPKESMGTSYAFSTMVLPSIPPALTVIIGGYLYEHSLYEVSLLVGTVAFLGISFLFFRYLSETLVRAPQVDAAIPSRGAGTPLGWFFVFLVSVFALANIPAAGIGWYLPLYLVNIGFSADAWALMVSVSTIAIAIGALAAGVLVDRIGAVPTTIFSWLSASVALGLLGLSQNYGTLLAMYSAFVLLGIMHYPAGPVLITERYESSIRARALGLYGILRRQVPAIVGPAVMTASLALGPRAPFLLGPVLIVIAASCLVGKFGMLRISSTDRRKLLPAASTSDPKPRR